MRYLPPLIFGVAIVYLVTSCHPLRMDWTRAVDMNNGRELYEAKKVESYLNTK